MSDILTKYNALTKTQKVFVIIGILAVLGAISKGFDKNNSSTYRQSNSNTENCFGTENCISKVRENFNNTGKTILGEEYLGNGKFGISFMDSQHPGAAYNATVKTDCNCNVLDVNVSTIR